ERELVEQGLYVDLLGGFHRWLSSPDQVSQVQPAEMRRFERAKTDFHHARQV
ncbi:MAG: hypothetical protein JO002_06350, partial [Burkholderiaceae bacterium]|nr:hypothetical protein [Burkholderiaceae bacterium]